MKKLTLYMITFILMCTMAGCKKDNVSTTVPTTEAETQVAVVTIETESTVPATEIETAAATEATTQPTEAAETVLEQTEVPTVPPETTPAPVPTQGNIGTAFEGSSSGEEEGL